MNDRRGVKKEVGSITKGSVEKIATLIISAFGLVAALAWNAAIQKIFSLVFGTYNDVVALLSYAAVVTVIAVIVTLYLSRLSSS